MAVKWIFRDDTVGDQYTLEINPNDGGSPAFKKALTYQKTSAADGKTIIQEGRDDAPVTTASGTLLTEAQYRAYIDWFGRRHTFTLIDDLARQFIIYITAYTPTRKWARAHPWKHTYTLEWIVLQEVVAP